MRSLPGLSLLLCLTPLLICIHSYGQSRKLKGAWITPDQDLMLISGTGDSRGQNLLSNGAREEDFVLFFYGDTLSFQKRYYSGSDIHFNRQYVDRYDLKIVAQAGETITLKPVSEFSKKFFGNRPVLKFIRQEASIDTSIHLKKILFHTSGCFGACATYHLEIDDGKRVRLFAERVYRDGYEMDSARQGYFRGILPDTSYHQLVLALQTCNLRTLTMNDELCCDAPVITLIIYYEEQRKYYKTMFPPAIARKVKELLYKICDRNGLERTNDAFELEQ